MAGGGLATPNFFFIFPRGGCHRQRGDASEPGPASKSIADDRRGEPGQLGSYLKLTRSLLRKLLISPLGVIVMSSSTTSATLNSRSDPAAALSASRAASSQLVLLVPMISVTR